jgi:hypothetical protein
MGRGLSTRPEQLASFLSPSPRVVPERPPNRRGASQLFAPRLRYQRCPPTPTRRALLLRGALRWMQGARRKRLHYAQRETGSLPARAESRSVTEWPTAVEGALRHSESMAASARTVGPPDETRPGLRASPWRAAAEPTRPCPRNKVWTHAPQCPIPRPFHGCALSICDDSCYSQRTYAHSLFSSCIAIAAQSKFALTDSCPTVHPGKERVGRRASNWRAING